MLQITFFALLISSVLIALGKSMSNRPLINVAELVGKFIKPRLLKNLVKAEIAFLQDKVTIVSFYKVPAYPGNYWIDHETGEAYIRCSVDPRVYIEKGVVAVEVDNEECHAIVKVVTVVPRDEFMKEIMKDIEAFERALKSEQAKNETNEESSGKKESREEEGSNKAKESKQEEHELREEKVNENVEKNDATESENNKIDVSNVIDAL